MERIVILILIVSLGLSCKDKVNGVEKVLKPDSITLGCQDYLSVTNERGVFFNNVWNSFAAKDFKWSQCLEKRIVNDTAIYGWSWNWPITKADNVFSYPSIKLGRSPWGPEPCSDDRFPIVINSLDKLNYSYEVETVTDGEHNLSTIMWIVNSPLKAVTPTPSRIVAEFMIWTYVTENHFNPAGKKYGEVTLDGLEWEVWGDENWKDPSGIHSNTWININFVLKKNKLKAKFDLKKIIDYALKEEMFPEDLYIADVELGNEIGTGAGYTWVKKFNVDSVLK